MSSKCYHEQNGSPSQTQQIQTHNVPTDTPDIRPDQPHSNSIDRWLLTKLLAGLGHPAIEMVLWDGHGVMTVDGPPKARIHFRSRRALLKILFNADLQFGETYSRAQVEVEGDLTLCLTTINRSRFIPKPQSRLSLLSKTIPKWRIPLHRACNNIQHHYDISNDFYRLWLDPQMLYTCAYFSDPEDSLETAQIAKMDHICRKLWLQSGDTVVDAGCGWGALALHMAEHYGVKVKAYNISKQQLVYAREQAQIRGLDQQVEFIEQDYRTIEGSYDVFVSVGMLEHVGKQHFTQLGETINRVLKPTGRGLIHTIGRDRPRAMNSWIEKRIFPGAYPPSISEMMQIFEPRSFTVLDLENLRQHYVKTLTHWFQRYESAVPQIQQQFTTEFLRAWRLYLSGSIAAFQSGELQLYQLLFTRKGSDNIPWHRAYLYQ